jgi:hypothetical protein
MIQVSEIAAMVILETLQANGAGPEKGLRLKRESIGLSLHIDVPEESDSIIWHNKNIVLIFDKETEKNEGDALVDVEEGPEEPRLVLRHKSIASRSKLDTGQNRWSLHRYVRGGG